jgi:Cu/Zn superoxide dismutase
MRPTIILLATMALVLVVVGGVATGQQQQQQSTSSSQATTTTTDKSSGDVTIQSTTQKASFTNGSGANFLGVKVSDHGNLISFESPAGQEQTVEFGISEGYSLCSSDGNAVHGYDQGVGES